MPPTLTSRERILRTVRGEPVDRVPVMAPIQWSPLWRINGEEPEWTADPNYAAVRELCEQYCDELVGFDVGGIFDRRFLLIPPEFIDPQPVEHDGSRARQATIVHTPKGDLRTVEEWDEGVRTAWYTEPLLKDRDDVARLLSVPSRFDKPDLSQSFRQRDLLGDRGLCQVEVSTPLVCASRTMHFDLFLEWCASEWDVIDTLIRTAQERIHERLKWVLEQGGGPVVWFGGSEQATPPMMPPRLYDAFVAKNDGPLFDLAHQNDCLVHVHCHGRISGILARMLALGVDMTDPVEPPPQGDVEIGEAKRCTQGRITLMGNIEFCDLEFAQPDAIERNVKHAILDGGREHTILYCSATPISTVSDRYRDNAIRYIEAGVRYGSEE